VYLKNSDNHLEHILLEHFLVRLPPPLEHNLAEVREVDKPVPGDGVGQVNNLLLHGVEAQHLHGGMKVLQIKEKYEFLLVCIVSMVCTLELIKHLSTISTSSESGEQLNKGSSGI
jgi:hypothetical protein